MVINYYDFEIKRFGQDEDDVNCKVFPIIETGIVAAENYGHAAQLISDNYEDDFDEVNIRWHSSNGVYLLDTFKIGDNE
jgi:hypothetical protein